MTTIPSLLDLFSGAGGAARGYQMAGFHVTGVDIKPQPHYIGEEFIQADALEYVAEHGQEYDAIHASPPCQGYSISQNAPHKATYQRLIVPVRELLLSTGKPFVIENVVGAPLFTVVELCGAVFGLKVYRHRRFETSFMCLAPSHQRHLVKCQKQGYEPHDGQFMTVTGLSHLSKKAQEYAAYAMGIDWMEPNELSEAIPPVYTEFIGKQLVAYLRNGEHTSAHSAAWEPRSKGAYYDAR